MSTSVEARRYALTFRHDVTLSNH